MHRPASSTAPRQQSPNTQTRSWVQTSRYSWTLRGIPILYSAHILTRFSGSNTKTHEGRTTTHKEDGLRHSEETPARTRNKLSNDNRRKQKPRVNEWSDGTRTPAPLGLPHGLHQTTRRKTTRLRSLVPPHPLYLGLLQDMPSWVNTHYASSGRKSLTRYQKN
jgi:hypothetical protein